jgi:hypothetical protein
MDLLVFRWYVYIYRTNNSSNNNNHISSIVDQRLYREVPIPKGKRGKDFIDTNPFTFELVITIQQQVL